MNRAELERYILDTYGVEPEYPWLDISDGAVFRHSANRKWFALMMDVPRCKLGLGGNELVSIVDLKCDPILMGSMVKEPGFFPGYHMNKAHWITAALDGSADGEKIKFLLELSYDLTRVKRRAPGKEGFANPGNL